MTTVWFPSVTVLVLFYFSMWHFISLSPYIWRRQWHPTPVLLPGKSHGAEPGGLQSTGSLRVGHDWVTSLSLFTFPALEKEMATHSSVLARRIPGMAEPGGLPSVGSHRVGHDWSDLAAAAAVLIPRLSKMQKLRLSVCGGDDHLRWTETIYGRNLIKATCSNFY